MMGSGGGQVASSASIALAVSTSGRLRCVHARGWFDKNEQIRIRQQRQRHGVTTAVGLMPTSGTKEQRGRERE